MEGPPEETIEEPIEQELDPHTHHFHWNDPGWAPVWAATLSALGLVIAAVLNKSAQRKGRARPRRTWLWLLIGLAIGGSIVIVILEGVPPWLLDVIGKGHP